MYFVERYGGIDGSHHKAWVLDQVARISKGTPIVIESASWSDGEQEYRVWLGEPSKKYLNWVKEMKGKYIKTDDYEGFEYDYDVGCAP
ncbi:hypothetical protein GW796_09805 [archaeon]|nr:hypothetical protein [archaeon]